VVTNHRIGGGISVTATTLVIMTVIMSSEDALLVIILVLFYLHLLNSILFYNYCTILLALLIVGLAQCSLYILI